MEAGRKKQEAEHGPWAGSRGFPLPASRFRLPALLGGDCDHPDFGVVLVPVLGEAVEDEAEVAGFARVDGGSGDRLRIDIRLAGADEGERHRLFPGDGVFEAVEGDLDGDGSDGLLAGVGDLTVDVGGLGAGDAAGLAHLEVADGETGGVGVRRGEAGSAGIDRLRPMGDREDNADEDDDQGDDKGDDPGQWRARLALGGAATEEIGIGRWRRTHDGYRVQRMGWSR